MSEIKPIMDELMNSVKELAEVIRGIENVGDIKDEIMTYLEEHTQHCADVTVEIRAAFVTMAEENERLRQVLTELETELCTISRSVQTRLGFQQ